MEFFVVIGIVGIGVLVYLYIINKEPKSNVVAPEPETVPVEALKVEVVEEVKKAKKETKKKELKAEDAEVKVAKKTVRKKPNLKVEK